ncbi:Triostin synthetase I [Labeo rohita]|uniref:Triostin synthetase I n=1 Tax=Labeo rohita TaxID=84645 RepID=A0ABQ8LT21_LABRO|nr:Triostin synthetase I [Labeo rohita]
MQVMSKPVQLPQEVRAKTNIAAASNREFLEWWKWDSIGAACKLMCITCHCGNCQPGGKEMTLTKERELKFIKEGLTYVKEDVHNKSPHWNAKYPWTKDPASLPNNRSGVEATFLRTERQLKREPEWKITYAAQIHEMVERGAAIKLTEDIINQ